MPKSKTLFHGGLSIILHPDPHFSVEINDFGEGFYCSENLDAAKKRGWAKMAKENVDSYAVSEFYYKEDASLKIKKFDNPDKEWLREIYYCRKYPCQYDVVIGPIADARIAIIMEDLEDEFRLIGNRLDGTKTVGEIKDEIFDRYAKRIAVGDISKMNQYVFVSKNAIQKCLSFKEGRIYNRENKEIDRICSDGTHKHLKNNKNKGRNR